MKQIGTLIGATLRRNDDQDAYATFDANEGMGGRYSVATTALRDAILTSCRRAGMECYCIADGNTYQLKNDMVTWQLVSGPGTTGTGGGGGDPGITLLSGNFGAWTPLGSLSAYMVNTNFVLSFKSDLQAFPTRAITYLQGQFDLNPTYVGTALVLGVLPSNSRPANAIKKYFIFQNIEMFLQIDTSGNVSLNSKDGINLPTTVSPSQPYYIELFFNPTVTTTAPTVYSTTRTQSFTKNNCGANYVGSSVIYSQTYTSTVDQATADALAASDPTFAASGQTYANGTGSCTLHLGVNNASLYNNTSSGVGNVEAIYYDSHGDYFSLGGASRGMTIYQDITIGDVFNVQIVNGTSVAINVTVNGAHGNVLPGASFTFSGISDPIATVYYN